MQTMDSATIRHIFFRPMEMIMVRIIIRPQKIYKKMLLKMGVILENFNDAKALATSIVVLQRKSQIPPRESASLSIIGMKQSGEISKSNMSVVSKSSITNESNNVAITDTVEIVPK